MIYLDLNATHSLAAANAHYYKEPTDEHYIDRTIHYHDFIYLIDGKWCFTENDTEYPLEKDDVLLDGTVGHRRDLLGVASRPPAVESRSGGVRANVRGVGVRREGERARCKHQGKALHRLFSVFVAPTPLRRRRAVHAGHSTVSPRMSIGTNLSDSSKFYARFRRRGGVSTPPRRRTPRWLTIASLPRAGAISQCGKCGG